MTAYPNWTAGEIVIESKLDLYTTNLNALCQVSTATGNTMASGSTVTIAWETEDLDLFAWHTASGSTITPTIAGWYRATVPGGVAADPDGDYTQFYMSVQKNSADVAIISFRPSAVATAVAQMFGSTQLIQLNGSSDNLRVTSAQINTDADSRTFVGSFLVELVYPT